ncbi:Hsp20 family protein [Rhizobium laguerreae]|uniref:Hsp20 family protein n=1 Tax=Rhizobium laguerreae TaxID=1076926 RepID=UPI001C91820B|nr:Hsp20 family protein [Rhizobium laguerreae]MBY3155253.1 Hsp20 family protein [Rhizobium laguerreae]
MNTRHIVHPFLSRVVGIERLFGIAETLSQVAESSFPPYNIVNVGDSDYRIELAVAGFSLEELSVETKERVLVVTGERKRAEDDGSATFIVRGIANRGFKREFPLADFVEVKGATLKDGILSVSLKREVPENQKHRKIDIGGVSVAAAPAEASVG